MVTAIVTLLPICRRYHPQRPALTEIWQEFFHQGPDSKPPVLQLMAKYGVEKWFCRSTTPEGLNNRKNIWNRRYVVTQRPTRTVPTGIPSQEQGGGV